jgi:hypothetical protein
VSHLVYYQRDDESEAFNRAIRDQMRRTSRERARTEPAAIDWAALRRRALEIFIMCVIVADIGLMLIAIRGERPIPMTFPSTDVTSTQAPHPAKIHSHL